MGLEKKLFENIVGKGEIACTSNFSFFHNVFYFIRQMIVFVTFDSLSAKSFNLVGPKFYCVGNVQMIPFFAPN